MKEKRKQRLKLISSFFLCLIMLFSATTLTFSWFAHNRNVDGSGIDVSVGNDGTVLDYAFYRINTTDTGGGYLFEITDRSSARLGTYDALKQSYPVLLKIYLKESVTASTVTATTATTYFLGNCNGKYPLLEAGEESGLNADGETYTNALSSIVGMAVLPAESVKAETQGNKISYRLNSLPESDKMSTFIDKNKISDETVAPETITLTATSDDIGNDKYTDGSGAESDCKILYILLSYDPTLISAVFSVNIGNSDGNSPEEIPFYNDFLLTIGS